MSLKTALINNHPERISYKPVLKYQTWEKYLENCLEKIITHESLHIVIYKLDRRWYDARKLDNVDKNFEISGHGILVGSKQ